MEEHSMHFALNCVKLRFQKVIEVKWRSSSYVPDIICYESVYHTNIDCQSITLTQSLIGHLISSQTWPPQRIDYLADFVGV